MPFVIKMHFLRETGRTLQQDDTSYKFILIDKNNSATNSAAATAVTTTTPATTNITTTSTTSATTTSTLKKSNASQKKTLAKDPHRDFLKAQATHNKQNGKLEDFIMRGRLGLSFVDSFTRVE